MEKYIYIDYNLRHTFVGTANKIAKELEDWEFETTTITNDEYTLYEASNLSKKYFWDIFKMQILPKGLNS